MGLFDRLRGGGEPRVAFFGIDGVPYSLIADNPDIFPNLTALAEDGAGGAIDSIVPPESSACWPSLTTGVNPGGTGVYGFQDRENGSYDTYVPMGQDVRATRIWDRVAEKGRDATVLNVPVTFPPQRNVQRMVSGFLSPSVEKAAYPDELREYLQHSGYRIDVNAKLGHDEDKTEFVEDAHETLDARYEAFSHYVEQDDWDLFFGVFMTTDRVNHFLFKDYEEGGPNEELFLEFYAKVDEYLGKLREQLPEDVTMVVASDHGFTSLDHEVHCNAWLEEEGWLSYESDEHTSLEDIAEESKAYSLIPGRFYINLEGREPRGSVPQEEYESVRAELKADLEALEGPDGRKVAERVATKEEVFRGEHDDIAPDLVVVPNHGFDLKAGFKGTHDVFGVGPRNGMHSFDNACLFVDDENTRIADADLLDIAPTILELLEVDVDRTETDGRSLIQR
ncbi:alkaline phosphatase family protein [Salinirubellus salinus]|uniref:Alkaline phosphatase family protein n=1 Tax=Salinirubellus salinus TaxID=1364945 RepID=A0A9E7UBC6_9EURY|nr:alkaline phosphatase family protein [Salinirubellus salinus]UWM54947.1 alkaline phosphatase family protein [Salinirubellus salinus]